MRIGLIGCGNVVLNRHLPALRAVAGVEIAAAADPTPASLLAARDAAGLAAADCTPDWQDLVARTDVDAVLVATPQRVRPAIAIAAAAAGKHLLCEKPLAISPVEARRMVAAARNHGVTLATVHNYVFVPAFRSLKEIMDSGEIGEVEAVILNFLGVEARPGTAGYRPRWRRDVREAGGGVLMDMLHAVYLAGWFVGANPIAVSATVDARMADSGDVEDFALVRYEFPRGHALVNVAWGHGPGGVELMGTRGRAILTNERLGTLPFAAPDQIDVVTPDGARELAAEKDYASSFELVARDFRDAVESGGSPAADGEAGVAVLEAVVAAYESAALGREVRLPLAPTDPVFMHGAPGVALLPVQAESTVWRRRLYGAGQRADGAG